MQTARARTSQKKEEPVQRPRSEALEAQEGLRWGGGGAVGGKEASRAWEARQDA